MTDDSRKLDLDIVSNSWHSLSDGDAYTRMIEAWDRKLSAVSRQPRIPLIDGILRSQLVSIDSLLDDRRKHAVEDPLEIEVRETPAPAMVLSPDGLVASLNEAASTYFRVEPGMRAGIQWLSDESLSDFNAVRQGGAGKSNADYAIVRLACGKHSDALAEVYQLEIQGTDGTYTVIRSLELEWYDSVSHALKKAFGMTKAECEICRLVFAHRDLPAIAQERDVSLETVRTQVKRILGKVEVHSKTELVRLLALLCARAATKHQKLDLQWSDPMGREELFVRSDGRKLGHSWIGDANGQPILFVPGQTSFNFFPEVIRNRLADEGIKLLIPSIPGHGSSEPTMEKDQLLDGCEAIEEWCESISLGALPVIATRGAQYYLVRLAKLRPDLFSSMMCVGLPWNITPKRTKTIDKEHLTLMKLSQDAPLAYELAVRLGYRMVRRHGPDFYWKRGYTNNPADLATTKNIEVLPLLRATVQHMGSQGYQAFLREQEMCARSPIADWVKDLKIPLHWMVPGYTIDLNEEDLNEIRELNPLSTLEVVPETGELLPFQAPEVFVDRVLKLARGQCQAELAIQS